MKEIPQRKSLMTIEEDEDEENEEDLKPDLLPEE